MDAERFAEISARIDQAVAEYLAEVYPDDGPILTGWVLTFSATQFDWTDGRERVGMMHPNVPYSHRLGMLTSAQNDLLQGPDLDA